MDTGDLGSQLNTLPRIIRAENDKPQLNACSCIYVAFKYIIAEESNRRNCSCWKWPFADANTALESSQPLKVLIKALFTRRMYYFANLDLEPVIAYKSSEVSIFLFFVWSPLF